MASRTERTPLISRRPGPSQGGRTNPHSQQVRLVVIYEVFRFKSERIKVRAICSTFVVPSSVSSSLKSSNSNNNNVFSPPLHDFDKDDRRGCCHRLKGWYHSRRSMYQQRMHNPNYYEDTFNPFSWSCKFGTKEQDGIWLNKSDQGGILMAMTVWLLIGVFVKM